MAQQLALSIPELHLILKMLEDAQKHLLIEIRHTDTAKFRAGLKERLAMTESLLHQTGVLVQAEQMGIEKGS